MPAKQAFTPTRPAASSAGSDNRHRGSDGGGRPHGRSTLPVPRSQAPPPTPLFWQCQEDAFLFKGPLGEPINVIPKGTVIWEQQRYEDPFRGWWVATGTHEGQVGWVDVSESAGTSLLQDPQTRPEPSWVPVVEKTAPAASTKAADRPAARGGGTRQSVSSAADVVPAADGDTAVEAPPGASVEYHPPCQPDGSTGLSLESVEALVHLSPSPLSLYEYYWSSLVTVKPSSVGEDWNQTYQSLVEALLHQGSSSGDSGNEADLERQLEDAEVRLHTFLETFYNTAEEVAVLFVKDQLAPSSERVLKAHPQHREALYYKGLLALVCIDTPEGTYGGDVGARKAAANAFRSYTLAAQEGPKNLLYVPLQTLVSFHGYTLLVSTIPPVDASGCLYAPLRHLRQTDVAAEAEAPVPLPAPEDAPEVLKYLCAQLSASLNLGEHAVTVVTDSRTGESRTWKTSLPLTTELYAGRDRRIYIVSGADRLLPASLPLPACEPKPSASTAYPAGGARRRSSASSGASAKSADGQSPHTLLRASLRQRLRPELLVQWAMPLNCDVAVDGCHSVSDIINAGEVADFVKRDAITAVASMTGLQLPVDTVPLPPLPCSLCESVMENELRFVVCQNERRCCRICSHCYTKRVFDYFNNVSPEDQKTEQGGQAPPSLDWRSLVDFGDAVRCGAHPRPPDALVMEPSVSRLAHASGLNIRFLPFVYHRLPVASRFATERYCEVELVARAAAHVLDDKLRRATTVTEVHATLQQFFLSLLQSKGADAQRFWAKELGPCIEQSFHGICTPLDVSQLSVLLLAERVEVLTGVELSAASKQSLSSSDKPFIEIARMTPRVKRVRPPRTHVSQVHAESERVRGMLSKLLLFWIGYAPKNCVDDQQPLYLQSPATAAS